MGLSKQANVLSKAQIAAINNHIKMQRHGLRNQVVFGLSIKAGLRAKEIACLRWSMLLEADGKIGKCINLTNEASKGNSGRIIPLNKELREMLYHWRFARQHVVVARVGEAIDIVQAGATFVVPA